MAKNSLMKEEDYHLFDFVLDFILSDRALVCFPRGFWLSFGLDVINPQKQNKLVSKNRSD